MEKDRVADFVERVGPDALSAAAAATAATAAVSVVNMKDPSLDHADIEHESESDVESLQGLHSPEEGSASGDLLEQAHSHARWERSKLLKPKFGSKAKSQSLPSGSGTGTGPLHPTYTYHSLSLADNTQGPKLTDSQKQMADSLNALPQLKKKLVYIDGVVNSHAVIIARDMKRFKFHERGLGVVREWAHSFVL